MLGFKNRKTFFYDIVNKNCNSVGEDSKKTLTETTTSKITLKLTDDGTDYARIIGKQEASR